MVDYKAVVESLVAKHQSLGMPTQMEVTENRIMIQFGDDKGISQSVHGGLEITNETWKLLLEQWTFFIYRLNP